MLKRVFSGLGYIVSTPPEMFPVEATHFELKTSVSNSTLSCLSSEKLWNSQKIQIKLKTIVLKLQWSTLG